MTLALTRNEKEELRQALRQHKPIRENLFPIVERIVEERVAAAESRLAALEDGIRALADEWSERAWRPIEGGSRFESLVMSIDKAQRELRDLLPKDRA